ncbi:hypothetical protein BH09ACT10_BH09ACT10_02520 [soil metagenome]
MIDALKSPALVGALGLASVGLLRVRDPHTHGAYGLCPSKYLLGFDCPGCGGLRAVNDLGNFDLGAALSSNILVVLLVAVLPVFYVVWVVRRARGDADARMIVLSPRIGVVLMIVLAVFTVIRNTPWGSWLAP